MFTSQQEKFQPIALHVEAQFDDMIPLVRIPSFDFDFSLAKRAME
jgi:hypothetical protein